MARILKEAYPEIAVIWGVDLNKAMLHVAEALTKADPNAFTWQQADAAGLPFEDEKFSLIICQQG